MPFKGQYRSPIANLASLYCQRADRR
ncbi:hypothetical protein F383_36068 [Gossypium arboreum]|uniref:Uncharacterized protein n=1 Tax=Gossypium arboreum TaxID=29729 RepID=A0A0B0N7U6_GOSAR|nr:hypothetical protein F383_36068 [Gossypium arboreum]